MARITVGPDGELYADYDSDILQPEPPPQTDPEVYAKLRELAQRFRSTGLVLLSAVPSARAHESGEVACPFCAAGIPVHREERPITFSVLKSRRRGALGSQTYSFDHENGLISEVTDDE